MRLPTRRRLVLGAAAHRLAAGLTPQEPVDPVPHPPRTGPHSQRAWPGRTPEPLILGAAAQGPLVHFSLGPSVGWSHKADDTIPLPQQPHLQNGRVRSPPPWGCQPMKLDPPREAPERDACALFPGYKPGTAAPGAGQDGHTPTQN